MAFDFEVGAQHGGLPIAQQYLNKYRPCTPSPTTFGEGALSCEAQYARPPGVRGPAKTPARRQRAHILHHR
eukprot:6322212-Prymnesium_polylepis.1